MTKSKSVTDRKTDRHIYIREVKTSICCKVTFKLTSATGYVALLTREVMCQEFSHCYDDVNICLWTDGSQLAQSEAHTACRQRNNSFLPRITDNNIQSKLAEFRRSAENFLRGTGFWIDITAIGINNVHWIDGSQLAGWFVVALVQVNKLSGEEFSEILLSHSWYRRLLKVLTVLSTLSDIACSMVYHSLWLKKATLCAGLQWHSYVKYSDSRVGDVGGLSSKCDSTSAESSPDEEYC